MTKKRKGTTNNRPLSPTLQAVERHSLYAYADPAIATGSMLYASVFVDEVKQTEQNTVKRYYTVSLFDYHLQSDSPQIPSIVPVVLREHHVDIKIIWHKALQMFHENVWHHCTNIIICHQ